MQIGRKIYYSKDSGVIIWDKGEMSGEVVETTFEQDIEVMPVLSLINSDMLGVVQFEYGAYIEQFCNCRGFIIDPINLVPIFAT
jgi:hypothetical protein